MNVYACIYPYPQIALPYVEWDMSENLHILRLFLNSHLIAACLEFPFQAKNYFMMKRQILKKDFPKLFLNAHTHTHIGYKNVYLDNFRISLLHFVYICYKAGCLIRRKWESWNSRTKFPCWYWQGETPLQMCTQIQSLLAFISISLDYVRFSHKISFLFFCLPCQTCGSQYV